MSKNTIRGRAKMLAGTAVMSASVLAGAASCPSYAASSAASAQTIQSLETTVWVRAKLEYKSSDGITDVNDGNITMASDKWKKKGDYYYYSDPVKSGESIDLMKAVKIPTDWDNDYAKKSFSVIVTVEASEALPSDIGWNANSEVSYSQTYETSLAGATKKNLDVAQGNISVELNEYQINPKTGKEEKYQNDKTITPGENISKIVRLTINGDKSIVTKKQGTFTITNIWTGDAANMTLLLGAAAACGGGALLLTNKKRKGAH